MQVQPLSCTGHSSGAGPPHVARGSCPSWSRRDVPSLQSTVLDGPAQQAQRRAAEDGAWGARTAGRGPNRESARAAGVGESGHQPENVSIQDRWSWVPRGEGSCGLKVTHQRHRRASAGSTDTAWCPGQQGLKNL